MGYSIDPQGKVALTGARERLDLRFKEAVGLSGEAGLLRVAPSLPCDGEYSERFG